MSINIIRDLRCLFGDIRDQGNRPTCLAFATSDAHAGVRLGWEPLSCEYLFYHAVKFDGGDLDQKGVTLESMLRALREEGQPIESAWTYRPNNPENISNWKPPANINILYRRDSKHVAPSVNEIFQRLDAGIPVILSFCLSDAFFYGWDENGVCSSEIPPTPARRHAVVATGHGERKGERLIMIRNSWGSDWCCGGYGWVSETYLEIALCGVVELTEDL